MGKNLIQQKRGKGSPRYRAPSFRYKGKTSFARYEEGKTITASITDIVHSSGHSAPLMELKYSSGEEGLLQAPEGIRVGDKIEMGSDLLLSHLGRRFDSIPKTIQDEIKAIDDPQFLLKIQDLAIDAQSKAEFLKAFRALTKNGS